VTERDTAARAADTEFLAKRLEINQRYSSVNFSDWILSHLDVRDGEDVLDVGAGTGAQAVAVAKLVGPGGSISALDISPSSVQALLAAVPAASRVEARAADMMELARVIRDEFAVKRYDLAYSVYALYYAAEPRLVLDAMISALKPGGRCVVAGPIYPHGLVQLAARVSTIPASVLDTFDFLDRVVVPCLSDHLGAVQVFDLNNRVSVPSVDKVLEFYRQTTYYDPLAEPAIAREAEQQIARTGQFQYDKTARVVIARASA
jgi:SAM-dependent methyltransferase